MKYSAFRVQQHSSGVFRVQGQIAKEHSWAGPLGAWYTTGTFDNLNAAMAFRRRIEANQSDEGWEVVHVHNQD